MSREQLPYMTNEQFYQVAFVFRSKNDGSIRVVDLVDSKDFGGKSEWEHLATLDSHRWIEGLLRSSQKHRVEKIKEILK